MRGHIGFKVSRVLPCGLAAQLDYFFQYVKLLLHFEQVNNTQFIVDNSPDARQVQLTADTSNPVIAAFETEPQRRFGNKSIRLYDGVKATVLTEPGKDFSLTPLSVVEFWLRADADIVVNNAKIFGTDGWGFYLSMAEDAPPYSTNRKLEFVVFDRAVRVTVAGTGYKIFWQPAKQEWNPVDYRYVIDEAQFNVPETSAWWENETAAQNFAAAYAAYLTANSLAANLAVKFVWEIITVIETETFEEQEYSQTYRQARYYYVDESLNVVSGEENFAILQYEGTAYEYWEPLSLPYFARTAGANDYSGVENGMVSRRVSNTLYARPLENGPDVWNYVRFARFYNSTFARFSINNQAYGPVLNSSATFSDYGTPLVIGEPGGNSGAYVDDLRITIGSDRDFYAAFPVVPKCPFADESVPPDTLFEFVELLLHLNGDYWNPAPFVDSSTRNRTVNNVGYVSQYPSGYGKFGGCVFFWPNHGGYLSIPYAPAWDFDTGPFTLEFWISLNNPSVGSKIIGTAGWGVFVAQPVPPVNPWEVWDRLRLEMRTFDSNGDVTDSVDCGPIGQGWTYVFIKNTEVCVGTTPGLVPQFVADGKNFNPSARGSALTIGGDAPRNDLLTAYVDEVRITRADRPRPLIVPVTPFPDNSAFALFVPRNGQAVSGFYVTQMGYATNAILLSWLPPRTGGSVTNYLIQYRPSNTTTWQNFVPTAPITQTQTVITDLGFNSLYDFRIAAVKTAGTGPWSDIFSGATTDEYIGFLGSVTAGTYGVTVASPALMAINVDANYGYYIGPIQIFDGAYNLRKYFVQTNALTTGQTIFELETAAFSAASDTLPPSSTEDLTNCASSVFAETGTNVSACSFSYQYQFREDTTTSLWQNISTPEWYNESAPAQSQPQNPYKFALLKNVGAVTPAANTRYVYRCVVTKKSNGAVGVTPNIYITLK